MDESFNCGSVAFLERIKHPISVARRVMEKTPHVMLVGSGAQQFAVAEGFPLEEQKLSVPAQNSYDEWLKKSEYKPPAINVEKSGHGPFAPNKLDNGEWNHDTIGMVAMDTNGNLSGSCTTTPDCADAICRKAQRVAMATDAFCDYSASREREPVRLRPARS